MAAGGLALAKHNLSLLNGVFPFLSWGENDTDGVRLVIKGLNPKM